MNPQWSIVELAHMELSGPSIKSAFATCVERGATSIVVSPLFLLPGRHWAKDIPNLCAEASKASGNVEFVVASPLGAHELLAQLLQARIEHCVAAARGEKEACDICVRENRDRCQKRCGDTLVPRDIEEI